MRARTNWLICNSASGSNDQEVVADICERLGPERVISCPEDDLPGASELNASNAGVLAIFTGDGTANAALQKAEGFSGDILMLPGGTTNLLSRSLHGEEATLDDILDAYAAGAMREVRRKVMQTSCGIAHSEVLAGPGAAWSDVRETMRDLDIGGLVKSAGDALEETTSSPPVTVAEPAVGLEEGYPGILLSIVGEEMRIDGYHAEDLGDLFRQGIALLLRDFRNGPHHELGRHEAALLTSNAPIELMVDGEHCTGLKQEQVELRTIDLTFLALGAGAGS